MKTWVSRVVCHSCFNETCNCWDRQNILTEQRWVIISPKTLFRAEQGMWEIRRESLTQSQIDKAISLSLPLSLSADILQHTISVF